MRRTRCSGRLEKNVTYGEELLHELGKLVAVDSYFSAQQQEQLKQIDSKDALKAFLAKVDIDGVSTDGDIPDVAVNLVFQARLGRALHACNEGCLLVPFVITVNWLIDAWRMRNLRFSLAETLVFVALFAACLSYEVSIAPEFLGMPQQVLLALPVAVLLGAFPSFFFTSPRWILVSLDLIILMEIGAFVVWLCS